MGTRFYLKESAQLYSRLGSTGGRYHEPSEMLVRGYIEGIAVVMTTDPHENQYMAKPSKRLLNDVESISCHFMIAHPTPIDDYVIGKYDSGDDKVVIVVESSREHDSDKRLRCQWVTVTAPTWEQMLAAIEKIRNGEIKPLESEQTLLEQLQEKLVLANQLNVSRAGKIQELNHTLGLANMHAGDQLRFMTSVAEFLVGNTHELSLGMFKQEEVKKLHGVTWLTRDKLGELTHIKSSRWHKLGRFIACMWRGTCTHVSTN